MEEKFKINFEEFGIEFTNEDFEGVDKETLQECKEKLEKLLERISN